MPNQEHSQTRAIIGTGKKARHFILTDEKKTNIWAIPGTKIIGTEIIKGKIINIYQTLTATTEQLKHYAKSKELEFRIDKEYQATYRERRLST